MSIKLELTKEKKAEPESTVEFDFRRRVGYDTDVRYANLLYLVGKIKYSPKDYYPIKVDGDKKEFHVRRDDIEKLGFKIIYT